MRTSEKFLLVFITAGILFFGSFVGYKYFQQSKVSLNASSNVIPSTQGGFIKTNGESDLTVRNAPYYNSIARKNNANLNRNSYSINNVNSANANTNSSNINTNEAPFPDENVNSNQNNANTNDNTPKPFTFAIIGDSQGFKADDSTDSLKAAVANISKVNPDLVMTEGDLVSSCDGTDKCIQKYDSWKQVMQPLLNKTLEVQGNHDRSGKEEADKIWRSEFDLPADGPEGYAKLVYSFDYGNSHFVVLDSEKPNEHIIGQDQRDWLDKDLTATKQPNIFVFYHEPAYPVSSKIDESLDAKPADRDALWAIFKNHKVKAVFSGHEHIVSRKVVEGVYQFVIGNTNSFDHDPPSEGMAEYSYVGHSYALVSVNGNQITVNVYKTDGTQLNSFVIPQ